MIRMIDDEKCRTSSIWIFSDGLGLNNSIIFYYYFQIKCNNLDVHAREKEPSKNVHGLIQHHTDESLSKKIGTLIRSYKKQIRGNNLFIYLLIFL
jgi:hypothetical protein